MSDTPSEYVCRVIEIDERGDTINSFYQQRIAKTLDDAVAWMDEWSTRGTADSRRFKYEIEEMSVIQ